MLDVVLYLPVGSCVQTSADQVEGAWPDIADDGAIDRFRFICPPGEFGRDGVSRFFCFVDHKSRVRELRPLHTRTNCAFFGALRPQILPAGANCGCRTRMLSTVHARSHPGVSIDDMYAACAGTLVSGPRFRSAAGGWARPILDTGLVPKEMVPALPIGGSLRQRPSVRARLKMAGATAEASQYKRLGSCRPVAPASRDQVPGTSCGENVECPQNAQNENRIAGRSPDDL